MEADTEKGKDHSIIAAALIFLILAAVFTLVIHLQINLGKFTLPFYLVVSGMFLFASALETERSMGEAIASLGGILTSLGLLLFYQYSTENWESWAYAWPLVFPGGMGLGQLGYGAVKAREEPFERGKVLITVSTGLFLLSLVVFKLFFR
ncbi:hypothetical protein FTO70_02015 [Methanosarcina sp. KYL-1]|uniref:hypothetical protein n=1 Tax=Methanosarcina sp. KYL-1 TaxID=2602068 RepID=UPI002101A52D|nr:hypothetical protein [Methanosarcina sp. KYL-1]MCQ1534490.1 hypothetical protein [Methanosarcina sp. KYL-1]